MKFVWEGMKLVIEPSAAVPLAVALLSKDISRNKMARKASTQERAHLNVGVVVSGGIDLSVVSRLLISSQGWFTAIFPMVTQFTATYLSGCLAPLSNSIVTRVGQCSLGSQAMYYSRPSTKVNKKNPTDPDTVYGKKILFNTPPRQRERNQETKKTKTTGNQDNRKSKRLENQENQEGKIQDAD
jgi:hypothetical protein